MAMAMSDPCNTIYHVGHVRKRMQTAVQKAVWSSRRAWTLESERPEQTLSPQLVSQIALGKLLNLLKHPFFSTIKYE